MLIILLWMEKSVTNYKPHKFKVNDGVRITKYRNIFSKGYIQNWSREIFFVDSVLKKIPGPIKLRFKGRKSNGKLLWKIIIV